MSAVVSRLLFGMYPANHFSKWTADDWQAASLMRKLIIKHLDLDPLDFPPGFHDDGEIFYDITLAQAIGAANKAIAQGRMPDAFYDEMVTAADQRRGGRLQ